jgi:anti-sigma B factor antagonist
MQRDFAIHTHTTGRAVTLALNGELDLVSGPALEEAMAALADSDAELVVVDLRGLTFMDSTGLHLLVQAQQWAHDFGHRFALIRGPEQVQRLFDLTGLADTMTIVESVDRLFEVDQTP